VSAATIAYFNKTKPDRAVTLVHAYEREPSLSWDVAVGMRGADDKLVRKVDAALEVLLASGAIRDIYTRYGIEYRPPSRSP
jgi:hypothetical protein